MSYSLIARAAAVCSLLGLFACQSAPVMVAPVASGPAAVQRFAASQGLTAKQAFTEAEKQALAWSRDAALTHVLGQKIGATGRALQAGSWTFSFVDYQQPERGFQVYLASGKAPQVQALAAARLPQATPLEDRAWEFDSDRLVKQSRSFFPNLVWPVAQVELTAVDRRLLWSLGQQRWVDAMSGKLFELNRRPALAASTPHQTD